MRVLAPLEAHRLWAPVYDASPNPLLALETRVMSKVLPDVAGLRVIDVASGTGRWARRLRAAGARVISVDLCPEMLRQAPQPAVIADAGRLPLPDGCADLVLCAFAFAYLPPDLDEMVRIARPGGQVLISDLHPAAGAHGWKRSFRAGGEEIVAGSRSGSFDELRHPRLRLVKLLEATIGESERTYFEQAGKDELFERVRHVPAVYVARLVRL